jgi:ketosteroid isomerase-like protein
MNMDNKETVLNCITAFNRCNMEWLDTFYSKQIEWNEMPRMMFPKRRRGGYSDYKLAAENVLAMFPKRKLNVKRSFCDGAAVILEQEFSAVASTSIGNMKQGDEIRQMVLSIFTLENGLIVKQTDYISTLASE